LRGDDARASTDANDLHDLQTSYSLGQLQKFTEALAAFRGLKFIVHALNSSASAAMWKRHAYTSDRNYGPLGARPGIAVYGIEPSEKKELQLGLKPVLSWASQLVSVHHIKTGDVVSYNATWKAKRPSLIGVVPVGYADGYSRSLSNKGSILCRGRRVPIVGTVCMDYFMVDLTDAEKADSEIQSGEPVVLIGEQKSESITAQEIADQRGTITYEVLTNISDRVPRMYLEGESK
jgi:alanine racemase